jgi:hypothetical protein
MADPIVVKVSELTELTDLATGDLITAVDVSEAVSANKTKKLQAGNIKLFTSDQFADNVVPGRALEPGAVIAGKIATDGLSETGQIKNGIITALKMAAGAALGNLVDNTIPGMKLVDDSVTERKLGAIVRSVCIPVYGDLDSIVVANFPRRFPWVHALDGHVITRATVVLHGAVSSSGSVTVAIANAGGTVATISVAQGLWSATTTTIAASYKTAVALAPVGINVIAAGTGAKGLSVYLEMLG